MFVPIGISSVLLFGRRMWFSEHHRWGAARLGIEFAQRFIPGRLTCATSWPTAFGTVVACSARNGAHQARGTAAVVNQRA
jgi:hypothetical protein